MLMKELMTTRMNLTDLQSVTSNGTDGTWEENWLFKKKKLQTETAPTIAMLIPSPTEEVKAFIGDKNVDEVSDLSEAGSDVETDDIIMIKNVPVNDILGLGPDSLVSNHSLHSNEPLVSEARNDLILIDTDNNRNQNEPLSEPSATITPVPRSNHVDIKPVAAPR